jgi:two-component system, sensor histidine kinase and response regulator
MRAPILLVDDAPANLLALQAVLGGSEHELVSVRSGQEALAQLQTREFAVVLLDLQMPVMDGVETATAIRRIGEARGHTVPIIFLTATDATVPRVLHAYASGAVDFIQKPLQPEILRSKVAVFADLYRAKERLVIEIDQRRRLQDALRARDELLAIVSHDLRNPLNAVLLGTHQIERAGDEQDWARARKAAGFIAKAADRMSRLVGDLLDLATLDAGKPLALNVARHDVTELAKDVVELLEPIAQAKQLTLRADLTAESNVVCDGDRIQQVLGNLIANAIKFTRSGGTVAVGVAAKGPDIVVSVRDDGVGICDEQLASIFEPFWKADATRKDGAGLGLSIARAIVEAHGGRIGVETKEGAGSLFYFTLRPADPTVVAAGVLTVGLPTAPRLADALRADALAPPRASPGPVS